MSKFKFTASMCPVKGRPEGIYEKTICGAVPRAIRDSRKAG